MVDAKSSVGTCAVLILYLCAGLVNAQGPVDRDFRVNRRQDSNDPETLLIRCYGRWGCLSIGGPFFASSRPVSVFPLHPEVLHIKFLLWTRRNPDSFHILKSRDNGTFALSSFESSRPIKFIVHDYKGSGTMYWIEEMARELLTADNYNVIAVDWQLGAGPPYSQAVANARMVGVVIADFIKFVEDRYRMLASEMHIIGHGLGAHVAGYAGENARGLGRITGLDPSAAYFEGTSSEVRLDPTDGQLVDVIHTDIGTSRSPGEGIFQESGHLDFYPNGGRIQPGCYEGIMATQPPRNPLHNYATPMDFDYFNYDGDTSYARRRRRREAIGSEGRRYVNCNHVRAYEIFLESINSDCSFYGYQCGSFRNFTSGSCKDGCGNNQALCAPIGMHADEWRINAIGSTSVKMYLETDFEEPLCRHHFHVEIFMSDSVEAIRHGNETGNVVIRLTGSKGKTEYLETTTYGPALFSPGQSFESLISGPNLGRLLRMDMQWLAVNVVGHHLPNTGAPLATGPSNSFRFPELYLDRIVITNLETGIRSTFCGDSEPVKPATTKSIFVGGTCDGRNFK